VIYAAVSIGNVLSSLIHFPIGTISWCRFLIGNRGPSPQPSSGWVWGGKKSGLVGFFHLILVGTGWFEDPWSWEKRRTRMDSTGRR
jgi:hypothetical protein